MFCFDTGFLALLLLQEASSEKIGAFFAKLPAGQLGVSRWARVELASLIAREVRMGGLVERDALPGIRQFDELVAESFRCKCQTLWITNRPRAHTALRQQIAAW